MNNITCNTATSSYVNEQCYSRVKRVPNEDGSCIRCLGKGYMTLYTFDSAPKEIKCTLCSGTGKHQE